MSAGDPSEAQRWEAFIYHWAQHHGVEMTAAARAALLRAAGARQLEAEAPRHLDRVTAENNLVGRGLRLAEAIVAQQLAPPAAPQGALF